jgi:hypothetical protein
VTPAGIEDLLQQDFGSESGQVVDLSEFDLSGLIINLDGDETKYQV